MCSYIIIIIVIIVIIIIINIFVIIMPSLWHHHYHHCPHHSYKFKKLNTFLACILCAFWLYVIWANNNIIYYLLNEDDVNCGNTSCKCKIWLLQDFNWIRTHGLSVSALRCSINWNLYFHSSHHLHSVGKTILQHQQFVESLAELSELIRPVVSVDGYIFPVIP